MIVVASHYVFRGSFECVTTRSPKTRAARLSWPICTGRSWLVPRRPPGQQRPERLADAPRRRPRRSRTHLLKPTTHPMAPEESVRDRVQLRPVRALPVQVRRKLKAPTALVRVRGHLWTLRAPARKSVRIRVTNSFNEHYSHSSPISA